MTSAKLGTQGSTFYLDKSGRIGVKGDENCEPVHLSSFLGQEPKLKQSVPAEEVKRKRQTAAPVASSSSKEKAKRNGPAKKPTFGPIGTWHNVYDLRSAAKRSK